MFAKKHNLQMILTLGVIIAATVIICISAVSCSGGTLEFRKSYYFVCYRMCDNPESAGALSETAASYGGAGYVLGYQGNYYVTLSCYYGQKEADAVCSNLKLRGLECFVLNVETEVYRLQSKNAKNNEQLYRGNLDTLTSLSSLAYDCANGLDNGQYTQDKAKSIYASITETLTGMLRGNENNCFTESIRTAIEECKACGGYMLSKNMRYIQIALADRVINADLT